MSPLCGIQYLNNSVRCNKKMAASTASAAYQPMLPSDPARLSKPLSPVVTVLRD